MHGAKVAGERTRTRTANPATVVKIVANVNGAKCAGEHTGGRAAITATVVKIVVSVHGANTATTIQTKGYARDVQVAPIIATATTVMHALRWWGQRVKSATNVPAAANA